MKKLLILLLLPFHSFATNFYISSAGSFGNNGTTTSTTWNLTKLNSIYFDPGDSILFKRGDTLRGFILMQSSGTALLPVVMGTYGTGASPVILGSKDFSSSDLWVSAGGNIWKTSLSVSVTGDIANLIFNNESSNGVKKTTLGGCTIQGDFFYNSTDSLAYIYSTTNPGSFYSHIEISGVYSENIITIQYISHFRIAGFIIKYSGNNAIFINETDDIIVENCDINWIGGMYYFGGPARLGNGIQIWEGNNNILVRNNIIHQIYDAGISPQGDNIDAYTLDSIRIYNNLIYNCEYSFEFYGKYAIISNIFFDNNTCVSAGYTWAHFQRGDGENGNHLVFWGLNAVKSNVFIRNNIFLNSTERIIRISNLNELDNIALDYNIYYLSNDSKIAQNINVDSVTNYFTLSDWKTGTGKDAHTIYADPLLIDTYNNFHLNSISPAINAGTNIGLPYQGAAPDIGAFEGGVKIATKSNKILKNPSGKIITIAQ